MAWCCHLLGAGAADAGIAQFQDEGTPSAPHAREGFFKTVPVGHRICDIIPDRKQTIFLALWAILGLSTESPGVLDFAVQIANYPSRDRTPSDPWEDFSDIFRNGQQPLPKAWAELFGPLQQGTVDDLVVVGQLGQSLDGRIATETGHSKYINGPGGLVHLHRLRALVDAVVIGVGSAIADDPQLTVRRVAGAHPARVVIDPNGRLCAAARVFADDGVRASAVHGARHLLRACRPAWKSSRCRWPKGSSRRRRSWPNSPRRGMRRILIEGGADTVSRFIAAGCLDRLHVMVAPIILGAGGPGIALPSLERADQAPRMPIACHKIDDDVLFDCDLSAQRVPLGAGEKIDVTDFE